MENILDESELKCWFKSPLNKDIENDSSGERFSIIRGQLLQRRQIISSKLVRGTTPENYKILHLEVIAIDTAIEILTAVWSRH